MNIADVRHSAIFIKNAFSRSCAKCTAGFTANCQFMLGKHCLIQKEGVKLDI